ncbi:metacaspase-4-like [Lotus japonicus]|uniref:metacaspase-4-like n=1 Tax=Lotus japonicus TaxID=34305 RepID=UPI00258A60EE|nr:metacaspase-4-like [Lotus japonicus]
MIDLILSKMKKRDKKNKKEAVLIGLNHPDSKINDAIDIKGQLLRMKDQLIKLRGFSEENITLFIDDEDEAIYVKPTEINIRLKLCSLVDTAERGDVLFVHLIGYGCSDGLILTSDKQHIPDGFFRAILMIAVRQGYHLTFVSDA